MDRIPKWILPAALAGVLAMIPSLSAEPTAELAGDRVQRLCEVYSNKDIRGTIEADLVGTPWSPGATGKVVFRFDKGAIVAALQTKKLPQPTEISREYLTYVVWSVDTDDVFRSLGELRSKKNVGTLKTTLPSEALGLIVTAEPHFAVMRPSDTVVLRAVPSGKGAAKLRSGETACSFLPRGHYALGRTAEELGVLLAGDVRTPGALLQARNAVTIAKLKGSGDFASERYHESAVVLLRAQELLGSGRRKEAAEVARRAVELAASAERVASQRRQEDGLRARELHETRERLAAVELELESAMRVVQQESSRREEAEARSRAAEQRPGGEEASLERIERAIGRLNQPQSPAPSVDPVPSSSAVPDRERALEEQLLKTRLEVEKLRLDMEVAQQRAVLERERERLETQRSFFEAEQARLVADHGKLVDERERFESERLRLERERADREATATLPVPNADSKGMAGLPEGPAAQPAAAGPIADPEPLTPTRVETRMAPAVVAAHPKFDSNVDASLRQREQEIGARETELDAREDELERARVELAERDAVLEATPPGGISLAENPDVEPTAETATKRKRSFWPFGRKKRQDEDAAETASLSASTSHEKNALATERAELDRRWAELQFAREGLLLDRQDLALERQRSATTVGAPALVQTVPSTPAASTQPPVTVVYTPPTTGVQLSGVARTAERAEIESQQRRLMEQQEQLIALTEELTESGAEADRTALQQQLDERNRAFALQRSELEQERARLESLGDQIDIERQIQERAVRRTDLISRLTRAGEVVDQDGWTVVRFPGAFVTGKATMRPEAQDRLATVAVAIAGLRTPSVTVEGHTDDSGSEDANQELSLRRAEAVRNRLVELGVPASSITALGIGEAGPIASNVTSEGRARNRRVDLIIVADEVHESAPTQDLPKTAGLF